METVKIVSQEWAVKNLDVTNFRNGDELLEIHSVEEWWDTLNKKIPAYCSYNFDSTNGDIYGKIYNWHAIADQRGIAPIGFRIPCNADWNLLTENIGGPKNAIKLTEVTDESNSNETGFSALTGGYFDADDDGDFYCEGELAIFWSFEKFEMIGSHIDFEQEPKPFHFNVENDPIIIRRSSHSAANVTKCGYYVRCIK